MNENNNISTGTTFPLMYAYQFLSDNGYDDLAKEIKTSKEQYGSYKSGLRRAKVVHFLDENNLLDAFINKYWEFGLTKKGINKINRLRKLYIAFTNDNSEDEEDEEEIIGGSSFAYEEDLKNYLADNLNIIESGLSLYVDADGNEGIEYSVDSNNKRIDILAVDKNNVPVVIELKVSKGYEKVIGQTLYYRSRIKKIFNMDKVRMIIVAREITEHLKSATEDINGVELFEYNLSIKLDKVN